LEAVANAEHETAVISESLHCLDNRREPRDGSAAKVIAIGEAPREDDGIDITKLLGIVPDVFRLVAKVLRDGIKSVVIAIAAGENDNADFHGENTSVAALLRERYATCS
jgi:hypothetical protein